MAFDPNAPLPPDLMGMLGGGMAGPQGPPPPSGSEDPVDLVRQIMRDTLAPVDANEEAAIANVVAKFQQLIAAQAKQADAAMGVSPAQQFMRRQAAGGQV